MFRVFDGTEHAWKAGRKHQHTNHLNHGDDAEDPVICVVRGGKPGKVNPGPTDGEARKAKADQSRSVPASRQFMRKLRRCKSETCRKSEIEEGLKRGRSTMLLTWISPYHAPGMVINRLAHRSVDCHVALQTPAGGSARRGQMAGPQGPLCHWLTAAETTTRLAGWRAGDLTLRELPPQGKVQKRIVRPAARGNTGKGLLPAEAPPPGVETCAGCRILPEWLHFSLPQTDLHGTPDSTTRCIIHAPSDIKNIRPPNQRTRYAFLVTMLPACRRLGNYTG